MGFENRTSKGGPLKGAARVFPQKIFEIQVLGNGTSGILRPSQHVLMSHFFFKFRELNRIPRAPLLDPPQGWNCTRFNL